MNKELQIASDSTGNHPELDGADQVRTARRRAPDGRVLRSGAGLIGVASLVLAGFSACAPADPTSPSPEDSSLAEASSTVVTCAWGNELKTSGPAAGTCDCKTGWTPAVQGQCCSPNSSYQAGGGCACNAGTSWNGSTCAGVTPSACPWGTQGTSAGTCDCKTGWSPAKNGQCCSPNSHWQDGSGCVCDPGATWNGSTCAPPVPAPPTEVRACDDPNYGGFCQNFGVGNYDDFLISNDAISSLKVPQGLVVTLYQDSQSGGNRRVITQDTPYVGSDWDDQTSSISVQTQILWNCYTSDGRYRGAVNANSVSAAAAVCNQSIAGCGTNGGCRASGGCDIAKERVDGCSVPDWLNNSTSTAYKEYFRSACNAHDECYHAPWDRIGGDGFAKCNDNFWHDMMNFCDSNLWAVGCPIVASVWADAMNNDPGRTQFKTRFGQDQQWAQSHCSD